MKINSVFRDLLQSLNAAGVRYLIAGGYAVMAPSQPGAPTANVVPEDFTEPEVFVQIGVEPVRVDIMTSVPGLDFTGAWRRRVIVDFGGVAAPVLSRADVMKSKVAAGRRRDRQDANRLARGKKTRPRSG